MTLKRRLLNALAAVVVVAAGMFVGAAVAGSAAPATADTRIALTVDPWPDGCGGCGNGPA